MSDESTVFLANQQAARELLCPECGSSIGDEIQAGTTINCPSCHTSIFIKDPLESIDPVSKRLGSRFQLIESLGQGSYGTVWKAVDNQLKRTVAIKLPNSLPNRDDEIRFINEAKAGASINDPGVVRVFDVGSIDGQLFIVNELIEGESLDQFTRRRKLSIDESVEMVIAILKGLASAHDKQVIHRDLKPSNILIDQQGQPRIADFGLAKRESMDVTLTLEGDVLGTPAYMSPEQALGQGKDADEKSDLYAVSTILFELLTGERPFRGALQSILQQIIRDDPPSTRSLNARVPLDLDTICLRGLEKSPQKRFPTATEMIDELSRYQRGEPIHSRPVNRWEKGWKWCVRNSQLAISLAVIFITLVAGITATSLFGYKSFKAEQKSTALANERKGFIDELEEKNRDLKTEKANVESQKKRADDNARKASQRAAELYRRYYNSGIHKAFDDLVREQPVAATATLNQLRPGEDSEDLRELFWYDLWDRVQGFEWELKSQALYTVQIPNSNRALLCTLRRSIEILDLDSRQVLEKHKLDPGWDMVASSDGSKFCSLVEPNVLRVFNAEDFSKYRDHILPRTFERPREPYRSELAWGPLENQVVFSHYPEKGGNGLVGEVSLYDYGTHKIIKTWASLTHRFDVSNQKLMLLSPRESAGQVAIRIVNLKDLTESAYPISTTAKATSYSNPWSVYALPNLRVGLVENEKLTSFTVDRRSKRLTSPRTLELSSKIVNVLVPDDYHSILVHAANGNVYEVDSNTLEKRGRPFFRLRNSGTTSLVKNNSNEGLLSASLFELRYWNLDRPKTGRQAMDQVIENSQGILAWKNYSTTQRFSWLPKEGKPYHFSVAGTISQVKLIPGQAKAVWIGYPFSELASRVEIIDLQAGVTQRLEDVPLNVSQFDIGTDGRYVLTTGRSVANIAGEETGPIQMRDLATGKLKLEIEGKFDSVCFAKEDCIAAIEQPDKQGNRFLVFFDIQSSDFKNLQAEVVKRLPCNSARFMNIDSVRDLLLVGKGSGEVVGYDLNLLEEKFKVTAGSEIADAQMLTDHRLLLLEKKGMLRYWDLQLNAEVMSQDLGWKSRVNSPGLAVLDGGKRVRIEPSGQIVGGPWQELRSIPASFVSVPRVKQVKPLSVEKALSRAEAMLTNLKNLDPSDLQKNIAAYQKARHAMLDLLMGHSDDLKLLESTAEVFDGYFDQVANWNEEQQQDLELADRAEAAFRSGLACWAHLSRQNLKAIMPDVRAGRLQDRYGVYQLQQGQPKLAIFSLEAAIDKQKRALRKSPGHVEASSFLKQHYLNLLRANREANEIGKQIKIVREMIEFDPQMIDAGVDATVSAFLTAGKLSEPTRTDQLNTFVIDIQKMGQNLEALRKAIRKHSDYGSIQMIDNEKLQEWLSE